MINPSVEIFFDDHLRVEGGVLRGSVSLSTPEPLQCKDITLTPRWSISGSTQGQGQGVSLFQGELPAGMRRFDFEVPLPIGPFTYEGHHITLRWEAECHVDLPWAIDKRARYEFDYPGEQLPAEKLKALPPPRHARRLGGYVRALSALLGLLLVGATLWGGTWMLPDVTEMGGEASITFVVMLLAVLLLVGYLLFLGLRAWFSSRAVRQPHARFSTWPAHPGSEATYLLDFTAGADLQVNAVTLRLRCYERIIRRQNKNTQRREFTLHDETFTLHGAETYTRDQKVALAHTFTLPHDAPLTLDVADNGVFWVLSAHIDLAGWPDWRQDTELLVMPLPEGVTSQGRVTAPPQAVREGGW